MKIKNILFIALVVVTFIISIYFHATKTSTTSNPVCYLSEHEQLNLFGEITTSHEKCLQLKQDNKEIICPIN